MHPALRAAVRVTPIAAAIVVLAIVRNQATAAAPTAADITGVQQLLGGQLAVIVPVTHNAAHAAVTKITVGDTFHPKVTVAGAFGFPTGGVAVKYYKNGTCAIPWAAWSSALGLVSGASDMSATKMQPSAAGAWSYRVEYTGDDVYAATATTCVKVDVIEPPEKATASIVATVHNPAHQAVKSVTYGTKVHPSVKVISRVGAPTGEVQMMWFDNGTCAGNVGASQTTFFVEGVRDYTSFPATATMPGTYSFRPYYPGDATFKAGHGACVPYTIVKASPKLTLTLHSAAHDQAPSTVSTGTPIHAAFQITGAVGAPTGSILSSVYEANTCTGPNAGHTYSAEASIDPISAAIAPAAPTTKYFLVHYYGNDIYQAATTPCLPVTWKAVPTMKITVHTSDHDPVTSVPAGTAIHARVKVAVDAMTPTGLVSILWFANEFCSGAYLDLGEHSLSSGAVDSAAVEVSPDDPGTYGFSATYGGDGHYFGEEAPCVTVAVTAVIPLSTPKPTEKPAATPAPTAKPTAKPTAAPAASSVPVASAAPEASQPGQNPPSAGPATGTEAPGAPSDAAPVAPQPSSPSEPVAPASAAPSAAAVAPGGGGPAASAPATAPAIEVVDNGRGSWLLVLLFLALVIGILFGAYVRRRSRGTGAAAR